MKLTKEYIGGFLENLGCFYIQHNKKSNFIFPIFRIAFQNKLKEKNQQMMIVLEYLSKEYDIEFSVFKTKTQSMFQISKMSSLKNFIKFIDENCFIKKNNYDEVIKMINKR